MARENSKKNLGKQRALCSLSIIELHRYEHTTGIDWIIEAAFTYWYGKVLKALKIPIKKAQLAFRKIDSFSPHPSFHTTPLTFSLSPSYHIGNPLPLQDFSEWQNHWPQMTHCLTSERAIHSKVAEKSRGLWTSHMPCSANPHERALVKGPGWNTNPFGSFLSHKQLTVTGIKQPCFFLAFYAVVGVLSTL